MGHVLIRLISNLAEGALKVSDEHTPACVWHMQTGNAEPQKPPQRCCRFLCCASAVNLEGCLSALAGSCWLQPDIYIQRKTAFVKTYQWISFWGTNTANPTKPSVFCYFWHPVAQWLIITDSVLLQGLLLHRGQLLIGLQCFPLHAWAFN